MPNALYSLRLKAIRSLFDGIDAGLGDLVPIGRIRVAVVLPGGNHDRGFACRVPLIVAAVGFDGGYTVLTQAPDRTLWRSAWRFFI